MAKEKGILSFIKKSYYAISFVVLCLTTIFSIGHMLKLYGDWMREIIVSRREKKIKDKL